MGFVYLLLEFVGLSCWPIGLFNLSGSLVRVYLPVCVPPCHTPGLCLLSRFTTPLVTAQTSYPHAMRSFCLAMKWGALVYPRLPCVTRHHATGVGHASIGFKVCVCLEEWPRQCTVAVRTTRLVPLYLPFRVWIIARVASLIVGQSPARLSSS